MGDNLDMDTPPPKPHDFVLQEQIMPTQAKTWILQLRRLKLMAEVHWVTWVPVEHYQRNAWVPWLWGQVRWWGIGAPWERLPTLCAAADSSTGALFQCAWPSASTGQNFGTCG